MRTAKVERHTRETRICVELCLDGHGQAQIETPIGFLNHMLETLARHGMFDLHVQATGDLDVDQHHLVEDLGLVLGQAFRRALGDKRGIRRAGSFVFPMDDAIALCAVDIGGRPYLHFRARFRRRFCGELDTDLVREFFQAFANSLGANIVVWLIRGRNDHHRIEAIFKALARSLREACAVDPRAPDTVPSTKGVLE